MRLLSDAELAQLLDKDIFRKISSAADSLGLECYVVGGYVRDLFLERPSNDIDVVVVGSGRFLAEEQPAGGKTGFTLWQPLRGGEEMYDSLDAMPEKTAELIYGYWIAGIDAATLKIFEA